MGLLMLPEARGTWTLVTSHPARAEESGGHEDHPHRLRQRVLGVASTLPSRSPGTATCSYLTYDFLALIPLLQKMKKSRQGFDALHPRRGARRAADLPGKASRSLTNAGAAEIPGLLRHHPWPRQGLEHHPTQGRHRHDERHPAEGGGTARQGREVHQPGHGRRRPGQVRDRIVGSLRVLRRLRLRRGALQRNCDIIISDRATDDAAITAP